MIVAISGQVRRRMVDQNQATLNLNQTGKTKGTNLNHKVPLQKSRSKSSSPKKPSYAPPESHHGCRTTPDYTNDKSHYVADDDVIKVEVNVQFQGHKTELANKPVVVSLRCIVTKSSYGLNFNSSTVL